MNPTFLKVMQRLRYEGLLFANDIEPKRRVMTLDEVLAAAAVEPRIYAVLPAIYRHRPQVIRRFAPDIKKHPRLKARLESVLSAKGGGNFYGIEAVECAKIASTYAKSLVRERSRQKQFPRTFRFGSDDLERLESLTNRLGTSGFSETLRKLIAEKHHALENPS